MSKKQQNCYLKSLQILESSVSKDTTTMITRFREVKAQICRVQKKIKGDIENMKKINFQTEKVIELRT